MPDPPAKDKRPAPEILLPGPPLPTDASIVPQQTGPLTPSSAADRQAMLPAHLREILDDRVGHVGRGDISRLVESWLRRRQKSMRAYRTALGLFADWLGADRGHELEAPDALMILFACSPAQANDLVEQWLSHLEDNGNSAGTVQARLSALRSLVKFARKAGQIDWLLEVDGPQSESYRDMSGPDPDAMRALIEIVREGRDTPRGARDWCLLTLLLFQALRRFEISKRVIADVELPHRRMWVVGKKRTEREPVELTDQTIAAIRKWLPHHADPKPDAWLLHNLANSSSRDGRLTEDGIHYIFQDHYAPLVAKRLGRGESEPVVFRPHGFRHASITQLVIRGENVEKIRQFARHRSLATTQRYIDRIPGSLRECAAAVAESYGVED